MEQKKYKPDIEVFFGAPYKAFCGNCGRILYTGGTKDAIASAKEQIKECPHCKEIIDWDTL